MRRIAGVSVALAMMLSACSDEVIEKPVEDKCRLISFTNNYTDLDEPEVNSDLAVTYTYDTDGKVKESVTVTTQADGSTDTDVARYNYNASGQLILYEDESSKTTFTYDGDRLIQEVDKYAASSDTTKYIYGSSGQLIETRSSAEGTIKYHYPNLTTKNYSARITDYNTITYEYDTKPNVWKMLFAMVPTDGSWLQPDNNITLEKHTLIDGSVLETRYDYTYDQAGRISAIKITSGRETSNLKFTIDCQ